MSNKLSVNKLLNSVVLTGEAVVVVSAALWMFAPTIAAVTLTLGAAAFIIGRMAPKDGDGQKAADSKLAPVVRHLYRQRILSYVLLTLAVVFIHLPTGFYFGIYMRRSMWLVPFIAFVVIEVYTAFRLPAAEKTQK